MDPNAYKYQGVGFQVADAVTQLEAARAVDENYPYVRRIVSEAKRFATQAAWDVVNNAMQIMD